MTLAGRMRFRARRWAIRRISWIDHRMRSDVLVVRSPCFFGCRIVGLMLDGSHHCESEHNQRDVTMPAMPRPGFVVVETELVFGCLKAVFNCPSMAFDADQSLDRGSCRTPGGEVSEITVGDMTADQQATCP